MKQLPPLRVWVFVDADGSPCLVQTSEPRDEDFQHFGERCFRYELDCDEPPKIKETYPR